MHYPAFVRLLILERTINHAELIVTALRKACVPLRPYYIDNGERLHAALNAQHWDMFVAHPGVPALPVMHACEIIGASGQDIPIIVLDDKLQEEQIRSLFDAGVKQIVPPHNRVRLEVAVRLELNNLEERRQRHDAEHRWREVYRQNKMLFESARDAIAYVHEGVHIQANPAYLELFGYKDMEELEGLPMMDLIASERQSEFKQFMRTYAAHPEFGDREISTIGLRGGQHPFDMSLHLCHAYCAQESCIQVTAIEESGEYELERKLREAWRVDPLTGLYNRVYFTELLGKTLLRDMKSERHHFLLYLGVDWSDRILNQHGLAALDQVAVAVGEVLEVFREYALIARFEEAMFALLVRDHTLVDTETFADEVRRQVESCTVQGEDFSLPITCSIGITPISHASSARVLLNNAYAACRAASNEGGNRLQLYTPPVRQNNGKRKLNPAEVREFIETSMHSKRMSLWYLPIVTLYQEDVVESHEIYLNVFDKDGTKLSAGEFFAASAEADCTVMLDKWIIRKAIEGLLEHFQSGMKTRFFVKVSGPSVKAPDLCLYIGKLLRANNVPAERLVFEISEEIASEQITEVYHTVNALRKLGCKVALEHYGMALNSQALIKRLPVDYVKIDASYSRGLAENPKNQKLVEEIVDIAHSLDKLTIAEGVEEAPTLTVLFQCKVDYVQGYYMQD